MLCFFVIPSHPSDPNRRPRPNRRRGLRRQPKTNPGRLLRPGPANPRALLGNNPVWRAAVRRMIGRAGTVDPHWLANSPGWRAVLRKIIEGGQR